MILIVLLLEAPHIILRKMDSNGIPKIYLTLSEGGSEQYSLAMVIPRDYLLDHKHVINSVWS